MLGKRGVDWMSRRNKQRCVAIHVTIPVRLLEDFDETIGYAHSRSKKIAWLMKCHMSDDGKMVEDCTTRQLMAAITNRDDCDNTLRVLLLQVLSQSS
jgi:metal-responsive CopG/Arc/MetJ family transcriptional regulator